MIPAAAAVTADAIRKRYPLSSAGFAPLSVYRYREMSR
jgi:hypothetical protein